MQSTSDFISSRAPEEMEQKTLRNFIHKMYENYNFVPYHNFAHAASVVQLVSNYVVNSSVVRNCLSDFQIFQALIIGLCHDNGHKGRNNAFYVKKQHDLSYMFFGKSVLENMHIVNTFKIWDQAENDIYSYLSKEELKVVKRTFTEAVINTDMVFHFKLIEEMKSKSSNDFADG